MPVGDFVLSPIYTYRPLTVLLFLSGIDLIVWKCTTAAACTSTYIESGRGEQDVCGLCDIGSMEAVVVRYVSMVMVLQGHHVSDEGVNWNSKSLQ